MSLFLRLLRTPGDLAEVKLDSVTTPVPVDFLPENFIGLWVDFEHSLSQLSRVQHNAYWSAFQTFLHPIKKDQIEAHSNIGYLLI